MGKEYIQLRGIKKTFPNGVCALRGAGLEPKRLQFCRHSPDKPPYAVLAEAVKGGRPGLAVLPDKLS